MGDFTADPPELYFPPPLTANIPNTVTVRSHWNVATTFKIKTTKPERYSVKPRMGFLQPNGQIEISIQYRVRGSEKEGWQPEDPTTIDDRFQLELRPLDGQEEEEAHRLCEVQDFSRARALLKMGATTSREASQRDDQGDICATLWKRQTVGVVAKRKVLKCHFTKRPQGQRGGGDVASPLPPQSVGGGSSELRRELEQAQVKLKQLVTERTGLYQRSQQIRAQEQELRSKKAPVAMPGVVLLLLLILFFYGGLVLDRYVLNGPKETPGKGAEL